METILGQTGTPPQTESEIRPLRRPWLHWVQPWHFVVRELALPLEHLPAGLDGLRIVALSDMHLTSRWHKAYELVTRTVEALQADVVLLTGDIVHNRHTHLSAMPVVRRFLPELHSQLGTFAILGNHDSIRLGKDLEQLGIRVLNGERTLLETGAGPLELIGVPGPKPKHMPEDFASRFAPPTPGIPRIVMAHFPRHFPKLQPMRPDIYLCGHTHGGQICLPSGFMLVRHDPSPRELCRGYHRIGSTHYIVNQGLGFSGISIRAFCPPEVLLLVLRHAGKNR